MHDMHGQLKCRLQTVEYVRECPADTAMFLKSLQMHTYF